MPGLSLFGQDLEIIEAAEAYRLHCAACHGEDLRGIYPLLGDWEVLDPSDDEAIAEYISEGDVLNGMPEFGDALHPKTIRGLVVYMNERRTTSPAEVPERPEIDDDRIFESELHQFHIETVSRDPLEIPWGIVFLPDESALITERPGRLRKMTPDGHLSPPIEGIPEVTAVGQGGLMGLNIHPDYENNGWVYLTYTHGLDARRTMTTVVRGRVQNGRWVDNETLFKLPDEYFTQGGVHFGSRIILRDGYLWFPIGDRGRQNTAQDRQHPNGSIFRLHDDGRTPADNPFSDSDNPIERMVWSYGHRNPQGLGFRPGTDEIWSTEHGPRGGDELNHILPGANYGWPEVTHGINYNGTPITAKVSAPGMEDPVLHWTPSIAVCGMNFYDDGPFNHWSGHLFAVGLRSEELHRVELSESGEVIATELIVKGVGRIRDVVPGPDGNLYLVTYGGPGRILRLVPAD